MKTINIFGIEISIIVLIYFIIAASLIIAIIYGAIKISLYEYREIEKIIHRELEDVPTFKLKEYKAYFEKKYKYSESADECERLKYLACDKLIRLRAKDYKRMYED